MKCHDKTCNYDNKIMIMKLKENVIFIMTNEEINWGVSVNKTSQILDDFKEFLSLCNNNKEKCSWIKTLQFNAVMCIKLVSVVSVKTT